MSGRRADFHRNGDEEPGIIKILSREYNRVEIIWMRIGNWMRIHIPPSKTQIQPSHERDLSIDKTQLFVVCPVQGHPIFHAVDAFQAIADLVGPGSKLAHDVALDRGSVRKMVGMTEDGYVGVKDFERGLGVVGADCDETGVSLQFLTSSKHKA